MIKIFNPDIASHDLNEKYYLALYYLESKTNLKDAAWALAIGQSVGNPKERSEFETDQLFADHSCLILEDPSELAKKSSGYVTIAFPQKNINFEVDGIASLLVQVMGGQCDIDIISTCVLKELTLTRSMEKVLKGPKFGLSGMKQFCGVPNNEVLLGGIVKPKVGLSPEKNLDLVKQFIDNGCNFIKEDEILSNQEFCPIEKRVPLVANYLRDTNSKVFYCVSVQTDPHNLRPYAQKIQELGGNGLHMNFHCGLGAYKTGRELDLPLLMHFQKSGDKILNCSDHNYSIDQKVLFELAAKCGCDTLHAGMIGGYMDNDFEEMNDVINRLNLLNAVPALSCGMNAGLVDYIKDLLGHANWMANVGGAITSHPMGTAAGVKAMKQAIAHQHGPEYEKAIEKWGKKTIM